MTKTVSVVIGIRDRYDFRIVNCLSSLRGQAGNVNQSEIVLVDYGSRPENYATFVSLCRDFTVNGVWTATTNEWSRSHCLNIGLRRARSDYVLVADVDIIFCLDYIGCCLAEMEKSEMQGLFCDILDLRANDVDGAISFPGDYESLRKIAVRRSVIRSNHRFPFGAGILFTSLHHIHLIRGFDETYELWGYEDIDLLRRLAMAGVAIRNISGMTSHVHQWHEKHENVSNLPGFSERVEKNRRYFLQQKTVVRNPAAWGVAGIECQHVGWLA